MNAKRWTKTIGVVSGLIFLVDVVYLLGAKLAHVFHSDTAANMLIAADCLESRSLLTTHFFYSNGDVSLLTPNVFALVPIAIGGLGTRTLAAAWFVGITLEVLALAWAYHKLARSVPVAGIAACVTLVAWSRLHVRFVYVELAYGMFAALYIVVFTMGALVAMAPALVESLRVRRYAIGCAALLLVITTQQPTRALVFLLAPLLLACAWPWRAIARRVRVAIGGAAIGAWLAGTLVYELAFKHLLTFSNPSGHVALDIRDARGIGENLRTLGTGIGMLAGSDGAGFELIALPGLFVLLGSFALVVRHVFASRNLTATRFVSVAILGQLGAVTVPMILGNLVLNPQSVRYAMPSVLVVGGLATIVALDAVASTGRARLLGAAWLGAATVAAALSLVHIIGSYTLEAPNGQWAHRSAHETLARELATRNLSHGFATYWNANIVTVLSHGRARTCPVNFASRVLPYRWNTDVRCFDASALPDRFFLATTPPERTHTDAIDRMFPPPEERFEVAGYFDVRVFRTVDVAPDWLAPPLEDGDNLRFPLHIAATHPQMSPVNARIEGDHLVATGDAGTVVFGPYVRLPKGEYVVRWLGAPIPSEGEAAFDVTARSGKVTLARSGSPVGALRSGELARLDFSLAEATPSIELRVFSSGGAKLRLDEAVIERR